MFSDGHFSHVNKLDFIKMVEQDEKHILLLKLPSRLTDQLQPLDSAAFGPLKKSWNDRLRENRLNICFEVMFEEQSGIQSAVTVL